MTRFFYYTLCGFCVLIFPMSSFSSTRDYRQNCYGTNKYYAQDTLGIHLRNDSSHVCHLKKLIIRNGNVLVRSEIDTLLPGREGELALSGWYNCDEYTGIDVAFIYNCDGEIAKFENVLPHSTYWGRNTIVSLTRHVDLDIDLDNKDISSWGRHHSGHVLWTFADSIMIFDTEQ